MSGIACLVGNVTRTAGCGRDCGFLRAISQSIFAVRIFMVPLSQTPMHEVMPCQLAVGVFYGFPCRRISLGWETTVDLCPVSVGGIIALLRMTRS